MMVYGHLFPFLFLVKTQITVTMGGHALKTIYTRSVMNLGVIVAFKTTP